MAKGIDVRKVGMVTVLWACFALAPAVYGKDVPSTPVTSLDKGFNGLYNLDFGGAQQEFATWQRLHPEDPMGPVSEAAGFLFSEFNRLGVLESQFYENNEAFLDRPKLSPDPELRTRFRDAIGRSEKLARAKLTNDPKDRDAPAPSDDATALRLLARV